MPTLSIRQLFERYPDGLHVSRYQRHYLWGQWRHGHKDAASYLTECLIESYRSDKDYFLQGITVKGSSLVDGQQRITYLLLLLRRLGHDRMATLFFDNRPDAEQWLAQPPLDDIAENADEPSQDIYYYKHTLRTIEKAIADSQIDAAGWREYVLDRVHVLLIDIKGDTSESAIYCMMNGTKAPLDAADLIKADLIRLASDVSQPQHQQWELDTLRTRYATQWDAWMRWWLNSSQRQYFAPMGENGLDLLLKLCLRRQDDDFTRPLGYEEFRQYLMRHDTAPYKAAKHLFARLLKTQRHFEAAFDDTTTYNRLHAIMLLQPRVTLYRLLHRMMMECTVDVAELERYYKLSFLGMTISEIESGMPYGDRLDDLIASLSMADVYHSDKKRDVFNLFLRLNIDEDTKLGRRFDFSIWNNRSLEHIYSKSKVWHHDSQGRIVDGNDSPIDMKASAVKADATYMPRDTIVNRDGTHLSEHCIGNLVLLYGTNNSAFGNATFDQKKAMFLSPDMQTVFQSRNLLHTVCVFAANNWDHESIVEHYNRTLKNLKLYYGY